MSDTVNWSGYGFGVYQKNTSWSTRAGVYIFCGLNERGLWRPYYIGQADSFIGRLPNHERWAEAVRLGATHVHARVVPLAATRDAVEKELIRTYSPKLNTHHVP